MSVGEGGESSSRKQQHLLCLTGNLRLQLSSNFWEARLLQTEYLIALGKMKRTDYLFPTADAEYSNSCCISTSHLVCIYQESKGGLDS